jgi:hypothetical protein
VISENRHARFIGATITNNTRTCDATSPALETLDETGLQRTEGTLTCYIKSGRGANHGARARNERKGLGVPGWARVDRDGMGSQVRRDAIANSSVGGIGAAKVGDGSSDCEEEELRRAADCDLYKGSATRWIGV